MGRRDFNVVNYDANMASSLIDDGKYDIAWHGVDEPGFRLGGLPFRANGNFRRLPEPPDGAIPEAVDNLAWYTAGATVAFKTDSANICLRAKLFSAQLMDHMTAICRRGFDLYTGGPGNWKFCGVTRFPAEKTNYSVILVRDLPPAGMREFLLEFPLYCGVESVEIGLNSAAQIAPPTPWSDGGRVVFYGTSITQGGCASRPGMCLTSLLSRRWNLEVVNLGFSGSGRGEPEVLELVASVPDPAMFVLDYVVNAGLAKFRETLPVAIDIIRARHPETPVVLLTPMHLSRELYSVKRADDFRTICELMRTETERRNASGDKKVHFVNGTVDDPEWSEYMVDGVHLTDLGFFRQYELVAPQLEELL